VCASALGGAERAGKQTEGVVRADRSSEAGSCVPIGVISVDPVWCGVERCAGSGEKWWYVLGMDTEACEGLSP
jgi:hypothetical protein